MAELPPTQVAAQAGSVAAADLAEACLFGHLIVDLRILGPVAQHQRVQQISQIADRLA